MQIYHTNGDTKLAVAILVDTDVKLISSISDIAMYDDELRKDKKKLDTTKISSDTNYADFLKDTGREFDLTTVQKANSKLLETFSLLAWPKRIQSNYESELCIDANV